ncbi:c-type cytochrome [Pseudonocardia sp. RS010]|uniref:cytochrome bc1 complex diheme cytochrome c subunit n=1 Tax=Pseudonocardia sp. RS010 TaxID=3385979 RepID=UPI00399F98C5
MTRRLRHGLLVVVALMVLGTGYALLAPRPQTATAQPVQAQLDQGRELYNHACITCHGANLQGVPDRGPTLIGVGDAAVYFQVSTGRMPLARSEERGYRRDPQPQFDPDTARGRENLAALGAYVQAHGGGPEVPAETGPELIGSDVATGGDLYRLNCAYCHHFTGRGGFLAEGRFPPRLEQATPEQMYTAMLSGPFAMPVFSDRQLTPEEKKNIIAYVLAVRGQNNAPGGYNLGEMGPATEGVIAFLVGLAALVGVAAWIGARS